MVVVVESEVVVTRSVLVVDESTVVVDVLDVVEELADVVVGIAASGRTPYVWGALQAARERGATTGLVTFNPRQDTADVLPKPY